MGNRGRSLCWGTVWMLYVYSGGGDTSFNHDYVRSSSSPVCSHLPQPLLESPWEKKERSL